MQLCGSLSILWHCLSLGLEWKLTFSSPVARAEFSKFAGILSAAVGCHIRHYWQNGGTAPNPLSLSRRHRPGMKELGLVILTCSFLSLVELAGKNVKVLSILDRSMRKHRAFCSCAQKIIYKVTIDICSRIFTKNVTGWAHRPQLEAMRRIVIWDLFVKEMFMAKEVCWV